MIRDVETQDHAQWRELWLSCIAFHGFALNLADIQGLWERIVDPAQPSQCLLAFTKSGEFAGMANYITHQGTRDLRLECCMRDLFIGEGYRGQGIGGAMIGHLVAMAAERDWSRIYWTTTPENSAAQRLYEHFVPNDGILRYVLKFPAIHQN